MQEPLWVIDEVVRAIHRRQIAEHGGEDHIRDEGLLTSALNKPQNLFHYGNPIPDIAAMAASYAYGIARNHPFVDGNKRTAFVVCRLFLKLNRMDIHVSPMEKYSIFVRLAAGALTEEDLAIWIRQHIIKESEK